MDFDQLIEEAINEAVNESEQGPKLTKLLVSWFREVSLGNEKLDDIDGALKHAEFLYDAIKR